MTSDSVYDDAVEQVGMTLPADGTEERFLVAKFYARRMKNKRKIRRRHLLRPSELLAVYFFGVHLPTWAG